MAGTNGGCAKPLRKWSGRGPQQHSPARQRPSLRKRRDLRRLAPLATGFLALVASGLTLTAPVLAQSPDLLARTDSVFLEMDQPTSPGCALSVMEAGAIQYERGYGMANLEYGIPITPRSVFHVASVSKHFTAMAIELLVNQGLVDWDDDIRTYVPEVPDFGPTITLRHLVHHVSGIRDQWNLLRMAGWRWEADVVTQKDVLEITSRQTALNFPPGDRYLYSNTGYTLLAVVVEQVTGQSLREFTSAHLFEPLGMTDTHFHDSHEMIVADRAYAYEPDEDGLYGMKLSIPDFDVVGATSLFTTVRDLAAWDRNFYTGRVGGQEGLRRLHQTFILNDGDTIPYAHGLSIGEYRGLETVGHGGADAGYRSQFLRFPDQQWTVAVLCNFPSSNPGGLARRVADLWLADELEPEEPEQRQTTVAGAPAWTPVPLDRLQQLVGLYRQENGTETLRLTRSGDTLRLATGRGYPLRPLGDHRYQVVGEDAVLTIRPPRDQRSATVESPALGDQVYHRIEDWDPTPAELSELAGTYHSRELGTDYHVRVENGELVFHHRKLDDQVLTPVFRDAFRAGGRTVLFQRGPGGGIVGFTLSDGRVYDVRFERVKPTTGS